MGKKGFTLIELLLAITFFSFILLFMSTAFIQINRLFVKGHVSRQIQHDGRLIVEDITRNLRLAENERVVFVNSPGLRRICFGSTRYAWSTLEDQTKKVAGIKYSDDDQVITFARTEDYNGFNCSDGVRKSKSTEMIKENTVVQYMSLRSNLGGIDRLYELELTLSTPHPEIIAKGAERANCEELNNSGSVRREYCSVVNFDTMISLRD